MKKPILFVDQSALGVLDSDSWEIISSQFSARLLVIGQLTVHHKMPPTQRVICPSIDDVAGRGKVLLSADPGQLAKWGWHKLDTRKLSRASVLNELQWLADRANLRFAVTLPLPPQSLHPNKRENRFRKNNDRKHYREECIFLARTGMIDKFNDSLQLSRAEIQTVWYFKQNQKHDPDNLIAWAKSIFDSLTIAGILSDDNDVIHLPPCQKKDAGNPRVEIVVAAL